MGIILKQGQIWYQNQWFLGDILIENGVVKEIKAEIEQGSDQHEVIDVKGKMVIPGMIDVHVHLREPGFESKETIETGTKAAVKGGFTTIAAMPNTNPVIDSPELISYVYEKNKEAGYAKVLQIGAITKGEKGTELADLAEMKAKSVLGFSDDGRGIQTTALMKEAMEKARGLELPIIAHVEDDSLVQGGVIHDGEAAKGLQVPGISSETEYIQLARDLILAKITGVHYHVCHVSTKESVELIREAKARGVKVTAEVTPHHLLLTDQDIKEPYSQYKMNPPLRTEADRIAMINGLKDGTIDVIATDHAPHTEEEKDRGLVKSPFGIVGLETAFPLLYTHLVQKEIITLEQLIEWLTSEPARLFDLQAGTVEIGADADITVIDLEQSQTVDPDTFLSKGKNTPFKGWELYGWPQLTIVNGKVVWQQEEERKDG